jgi:hypothetical protein
MGFNPKKCCSSLNSISATPTYMECDGDNESDISQAMPGGWNSTNASQTFGVIGKKRKKRVSFSVEESTFPVIPGNFQALRVKHETRWPSS